MIKEIMESMLADCKPAERLHKLTICRNELNDMIADFNKHWNWCPRCDTYMHDEETYVELMHDFSPARNVRKCNKCNSILKLLD